jgi:hypothetical protein
MNRIGVTVLLSLVLTLPGSAETLRVKVLDPEGQALNSAVVDGLGVTLIRENEDRRVAPAGPGTLYQKKGPFIFSNVLPGRYTVRVSAPGYLPVRVGPIFIEERLLPAKVVDEIVVVLNRIKEIR